MSCNEPYSELEESAPNVDEALCKCWKVKIHRIKCLEVTTFQSAHSVSRTFFQKFFQKFFSEIARKCQSEAEPKIFLKKNHRLKMLRIV